MTDTTTAPMTQSERRDMFAAAALTGLLANVDANGPHWQGHPNAISAMAFKHADAMIAASKEKDGE